MRRKKLCYRRCSKNDEADAAISEGVGEAVGDVAISEGVGVPIGEPVRVPEVEEEVGLNDGDDCDVVGDEDVDEIMDDVVDEPSDKEDDEEEDEDVFEEEVSHHVDESDDSGDDDAWNDEVIPNHVSSDNEEEEDEHREHIDPEELLALGKTFGCANDVKLALLRYSLKTRYDIKFSKSSKMKVSAKCSDSEVNAPMRRGNACCR
ncbi:hypothetical protein AALP_AA6G220700 [Arabis alpina]|uniref:Transposase MuDR plant domain-containing protein n=1 Tax=Arabis alpina TaxID=50452 RepID=A0A087GQW9_ARAAL|nr:hypothetical protein AALP_AA6G220700 [Arabis alpina]